MKTLLAALLFFLFLLPFGCKLAVMVDFGLRQEYIAEVLCINQDRPELKCGGTCYLMQQMTDYQQHKDQEILTRVFDFAPYFQEVNSDLLPFGESQTSPHKGYRFMNSFMDAGIIDLCGRPPA